MIKINRILSLCLAMAFTISAIPQNYTARNERQLQEFTSARKLKILFVGNSLTYVNDLPALIVELGKMDSVLIRYKTLAFPDYSIEDHLNDGKVQVEVSDGKYDFVIVQQGPSALPESQALLLGSGKQLAEICKSAGTKLAFYMVWPSKARLFDLDNVIVSYTNVANATSSLLCPAGLAWKYAWQADPSLALYSFDDFHPSVTGTTLAALTIYGKLLSKRDFDFIKDRKSTWSDKVDSSTIKLLEEAALKSINK